MTASSAQAGTMGAAALWEDFTKHLRAGRMRQAYGCFSPLSRNVFTYQSFLNHYHPCMAASEATLTPIEEGRFRVSGDLAELRFLASTGATPDGGKDAPAIYVNALLSRETDNRWYLVAAAAEGATRLEAGARGLLRRLWPKVELQQAVQQKQPMDHNTILKTCSRHLRSGEALFFLRHYRLSLEPHGDRWLLKALPLKEKAGVRPFCLGQSGKVHVFQDAAVLEEPDSDGAPDLGDPALSSPPDRGDPAADTASTEPQTLPAVTMPARTIKTTAAADAAPPPAPEVEMPPLPSAMAERPAPRYNESKAPDMGDPAAAEPAVPTPLPQDGPATERPATTKRIEQPAAPAIQPPSLPPLPALPDPNATAPRKRPDRPTLERNDKAFPFVPPGIVDESEL